MTKTKTNKEFIFMERTHLFITNNSFRLTAVVTVPAGENDSFTTRKEEYDVCENENDS